MAKILLLIFLSLLALAHSQSFTVTRSQFNEATLENGYPLPSAAQYESFVAGIPNGNITTKREAAMALAQFLHESDGLRAKREYRCMETGCPGLYETPGCDVEGQRYFGRGYIQTTWCYNYKAAQEDLGLGNQLVNDPDSVAQNEDLAWNTAFSYWKRMVHNAPGVQEGQFGATTNAINGILECNNGENAEWAEGRFFLYEKVYAAFGLSGTPDPRGCYETDFEP